MAERVEIDIVAKDKASGEIQKVNMNLREMGEKVSSLGMRFSAAFTLPVVGAFAAATKASKELQGALLPWQNQLNRVAMELGQALVPVIIQLTPYVVQLTQSIIGAIQWFEGLDMGTKNLIVGFIAFVAAMGPVIAIVGQVINVIGTIQMLLPGLQTAFVTTGATATAAFAPLLPLLIAIAGLIALINSPFGQKGITAGKQLLAMGAGFGGFVMSGGSMEAGNAALLRASNDMGLINTPSANRGGTTVVNNYNGVMVTPQNQAALKPYLDNYNRQNGGK